MTTFDKNMKKPYTCECGFKFSKPGEFRNCDAFITKDGKSGVICPICKKTICLSTNNNS